jgi:hypothetical protein
METRMTSDLFSYLTIYWVGEIDILLDISFSD